MSFIISISSSIPKLSSAVLPLCKGQKPVLRTPQHGLSLASEEERRWPSIRPFPEMIYEGISTLQEMLRHTRRPFRIGQRLPL